MVPWLWFLTQTARCYLFFPEKEKKSIFEVIEAVINRAKSDLHVDPVSDLQGIGELKNRKVKHCVQYRETDFNFLSRTMEKYGVFYYFKFEDGKHTLVLDMKKNYPPCEEAEVAYPRISGAQPAGDHVTMWAARLRVRAGQMVAHRLQLRNAFNIPDHERAQAARRWMCRRPTSTKSTITPAGTRRSPMARPTLVSARKRRSGSTTPSRGPARAAPSCAGHKFTLTTHPDEDVVSEQGASYVLTSVQHAASQPSDEHRRRRRRQLQQSLHVHRRFGAVPPGPDHAMAGDLGSADRCGRRPGRQRDLYRQVRPGEGAVPLGSGGQTRREQLLLDSRVADVGRQGMGLGVDAANRP